MSVLLARKGRHKQRYDADGCRLVAGCIPYKLVGNVEDCNLMERLKVLMISTPNRHDLVFPKGGWENDETVIEAARREAHEEAGVTGVIDENPLGVWEFRSKSRQNVCSMEGTCRGYMFALEVTVEKKSWPEQSIYGRKWLTIEEATQRCRYPWMQEALERFFISLSETSMLKNSKESDADLLPNNFRANDEGFTTDDGTSSSRLSQGCGENPSNTQLEHAPINALC